LEKKVAGEEGLQKMLDAAPDVDLATRELLTFSMLISLGGCDPQAKGHVAGNLRVGNSRATLIDVVTQLLPFIGYPRTLNALRAIDEVVPYKAA
jgi:4-carboxymuconolactone decarboxylase